MAEGATFYAGGSAIDPNWAPGFPQRILAHAERDPGFVLCQRSPTPPGADPVDGLRLDELLARAQHWCRLYSDHGLSVGDRVVFSLSDPHAVLSGMLGAMLSGVVAVPLQTVVEFRTPELFRDRLTAVADDCSPGLIVVDHLERFTAALQGFDLGAPVVELAPRPDGPAGRASLQVPPPDDLQRPVLIQYTSGSTGSPRGVVITHANLVANLAAIGLAFDAQPDDRLTYWLPLHHDMGLIGCLLYSAYWRIPSCVLSPMQFFTRPVSWMEAIHRFRATLTVSPLFAFGLCLNRLSDKVLEGLDLSCLRLALCGAEPIDPAVVSAFLERFGRWGFRPQAFYPVYGLAEATLAVTFPPPGDPVVVDHVDRRALAGAGRAEPSTAPCGDRVARFVSVGHAMPGLRVRVADPDSGRDLPDRSVGEVRVSGPSVSPGYYGQVEAGGGREELATGDLGYLAEGQLFVVDRLKDLIIIAGQNFVPSDVEACLARVRGVRAGRAVAFSVPGQRSTEALVVVAELDRRSWRGLRAIARDIVAAVNRRMGLELEHVVIVAPGTLQRTTSGKLKRRASREDFLAGRFPKRLSIWRRLGAKLAPARLLLLRVAGQR